MDHNNILGTVLAGGKSQRFGEDKSQVKLADKSLIDYMLMEIINDFDELLIVSNDKIKFKKSEKISIIEDFKKAWSKEDNGLIKIILINIIINPFTTLSISIHVSISSIHSSH